MSAIVQSSRPATSNRRRSVRQKAHVPAYASFGGASKNEIFDPCEVLDISEGGVAVQGPLPMEINQQVDLCLDLAESSEQLSVTARVVWSDSAGRVGLGFPTPSDFTFHRLREWLFLNAMAGAANAESSWSAPSLTAERSVLRQNYTNTFSAAAAVEREVESLGTNLEAVFSLIALRSHSLLRASGAAIALAGKDAATMTCRASAGQSVPPVGATLQVGLGFSGECIRTGRILRCDDTETDDLVDRQNCRALGIRSMLAVPVRSGETVIGLLEVFSARPSAFGENDRATLQRFTEMILAAVNRAARSDHPSDPTACGTPFSSAPGSILFVHEPENGTDKGNPSASEDKVGGIHLPRAHRYLLYCATATIALVLGFMLVRWIQVKPQVRERSGEPAVLASSRPTVEGSKQDPSLNSGEIEQLRVLASHGNPTAENAMGLLYSQGDEKHAITQDQSEAVRWFTKAAEHGSAAAQYKLGLLYWDGHGVPKDANKAYYWAVLACAGGQAGSKDLVKVLANGISRSQAAAIEQQAEIWHQQHESHARAEPGR